MLSKTGSYKTNPNGTTTSYDKENRIRKNINWGTILKLGGNKPPFLVFIIQH